VSVEVVVLESEAERARLVADAVVALVRRRPAAVLGLATGSSPSPVYAELVRRYAAGEVTFAAASAFTLDEYLGLPAAHPEGYRRVIEREFASLIDLPAERLHTPDGQTDDVPAACAAYERLIAGSGGVDLQLLGIGSDGHLAFNEPGSSLASRTRVKTLTPRTREDNARFFDAVDAVPHHVLTQGLGTILEARHLVMLATGAGKAEAVRQAVEGPVTAMCPASALQLHPHVTVVLDPTAAARLSLRDYYAQVWADKPDWQGI
jgi:glucosamine-6-phosphate deaminase